VDSEVLLTGAALSNAKVGTSTSLSASGRYHILMEFTPEGAQRFATIMGRMDVGELLAIILDDTIYSAPAISQSIKDAAAQGWRSIVDSTTITGNFSEEEVKILAIALRAGALPVGINIAEETTVGPTLGADSIRRGMMTIAIGFILILIYMFAFYRLLGFVANLALVLNMLIVFAALNVFGAVLTLPGIAGIILTIGMTVDANVIIFERIKEERRTGKSPLAAVRAGFEKSLSTLFDANITTLITAFILLMLGTGPVRGFAVTLGIGVIGSLFCALVVSRLLMEKTGFSSFIPVKVSQEQ
jgi:preprotein translocase subunit SecD